jgi:hypothetical protein
VKIIAAVVDSQQSIDPAIAGFVDANFWNLLTDKEKDKPDCWCHTCRPVTLTDMRMVLCPTCGNKRCPKATNHVLDCSGSNEVGQPGSVYAMPEEGKE